MKLLLHFFLLETLLKTKRRDSLYVRGTHALRIRKFFSDRILNMRFAHAAHHTFDLNINLYRNILLFFKVDIGMFRGCL